MKSKCPLSLSLFCIREVTFHYSLQGKMPLAVLPSFKSPGEDNGIVRLTRRGMHSVAPRLCVYTSDSVHLKGALCGPLLWVNLFSYAAMASCSSNHEEILSPYSSACVFTSFESSEYMNCPLCARLHPLYGLCEPKQSWGCGDITSYFCRDASVSANSLLDFTSPFADASHCVGSEIKQDPSSHSSRPSSDCSTVTRQGEAVRHRTSSAAARSQEAHRSLEIPRHSTALRSPFVYQPLTQLNHVDSAGHSSANDDTPHPDIFSPTPSPVHTTLNPTENTWLPRRRLSYEPEPYRRMGFEQDKLLDTPRCRREGQEIDCDWGQWIEEMDQPVQNNRLCYSEPSRRKPRLLPDFSEEDETIEEAVCPESLFDLSSVQAKLDHSKL